MIIYIKEEITLHDVHFYLESFFSWLMIYIDSNRERNNNKSNII